MSPKSEALAKPESLPFRPLDVGGGDFAPKHQAQQDRNGWRYLAVTRDPLALGAASVAEQAPHAQLGKLQMGKGLFQFCGCLAASFAPGRMAACCDRERMIVGAASGRLLALGKGNGGRSGAVWSRWRGLRNGRACLLRVLNVVPNPQSTLKDCRGTPETHPLANNLARNSIMER